MLRALLPILVDVVCVFGFAAGGKSAHDANASWTILFVIAWPFLIGLALGWAGAIWNGMRGLRVWPGGLLIVTLTYVVGMIVRQLSGRGIETGFLIVAAIFLTVTMLGWRTVAALVRR